MPLAARPHRPHIDSSATSSTDQPLSMEAHPGVLRIFGLPQSDHLPRRSETRAKRRQPLVSTTRPEGSYQCVWIGCWARFRALKASGWSGPNAFLPGGGTLVPALRVDSRQAGTQVPSPQPARRPMLSQVTEEAMQATEPRNEAPSRHAKCVEASKRIRWDIDHDVIRGRSFDYSKKFLPDGLSKVGELEFLGDAERRLLSQIQGRTYANIFGLVERYIAAKVLELSREHWLGDQNALEALVRFSDEELKHQELFRRIEQMMAVTMPAGYRFELDPNAVARAVLDKSTWSVLLLTLHIELFVQNHYRQSIEPDGELSELFKDVFL